MDTGVPVTGEERQYNYGSTFKTLAIYYAEILGKIQSWFKIKHIVGVLTCIPYNIYIS